MSYIVSLLHVEAQSDFLRLQWVMAEAEFADGSNSPLFQQTAALHT